VGWLPGQRFSERSIPSSLLDASSLLLEAKKLGRTLPAKDRAQP
jgi:hypothetical protein